MRECGTSRIPAHRTKALLIISLKPIEEKNSKRNKTNKKEGKLPEKVGGGFLAYPWVETQTGAGTYPLLGRRSKQEQSLPSWIVTQSFLHVSCKKWAFVGSMTCCNGWGRFF